jgi:hypothetical protein
MPNAEGTLSSGRADPSSIDDRFQLKMAHAVAVAERRGCGYARGQRGGLSRALETASTKEGSAMKKFLVLYKAPGSAFEQMKSATPEQQKAGMDAWMTWSKKAQSSIVDMGSPLGKSMRVTKGGGASPSNNDLGGYSILQAESKEALAKSLEGHPHFMMPDGSIEIVEVMPIPGM